MMSPTTVWKRNNVKAKMLLVQKTTMQSLHIFYRHAHFAVFNHVQPGYGLNSF